MFATQSYDRADSRMEGATEQDCAKKRTDANNIKYFITGVFINFLSASVSPLFFPVFVLFSL